MKVLIADDEKLIVDDLTHEVRELYPDAVIDGVSAADEALKLAEQNTYDVALLDIDMPETDGLTLARKFIASSPFINIIFVTGYAEYALEAHDLYCSAFLLKPVGSRKLKEAFSHLRVPFLNISQDFYEAHYAGSDVIGKKLEMYREQRGLSRQEVADTMNVTRQTVFRWEHGERIPDVLTFVRLTRLLGVSMETVLSDDP